MSKEFDTFQPNTWCPGCTNNIVLNSVKNVLVGKTKSGLRKRDLVLVSDIGCAGKFYDHLRMNGFYALHGRTLPVAFGVKMANPSLKVIGFIGDGGAYAEGMAHLIQLARLNPDLTVLILNNRIFALTVGQATPVTEIGYRGNTTPDGLLDEPFNPLDIILASGGSFIARASSLDPKSLEGVIKRGIEHVGFSVIEVMQPCISFRSQDLLKLRQNHYWISDRQRDISEARKLIQSWNYGEGRIPLGVFYQKSRKTWGEKHETKNIINLKRKINRKSLAEEILR